MKERNITKSSMDKSQNQNTADKRMITKGFLVVCTSFLLLFTGYRGMSVLQSSINAEDGLGTYTLAGTYVAQTLAACFLPAIVIDKLTVKWTIIFSEIFYAIYIAAQFYPTFYTLMPTAILVGAAAAPLWASKSIYLTQASNKYAELTEDKAEVIVVRSFGIFFLFFQLSGIFGNLISSLVLNSEDTITNPELLDICGINFCPEYGETSNNTNLDRPPNYEIYTLASACLLASLLAPVVVALFLHPMSKLEDKQEEEVKKSPTQLFFATFRHLRNPYQLLLIPPTFWPGVTQGFFGSEFSRAYVSCVFGAGYIGYIFICYGVANSLSCVLVGYIVRFVDRVVIFMIAAACNGTAIVLMFTWTPDPDTLLLLFIIAVMWGAADAVWQTQINGLYGILFDKDKEAGFSNYRLWESLGFVLTFILNNVSCVRPHAWTAVGCLAVAMTAYFTLEILLRRNKRKS